MSEDVVPNGHTYELFKIPMNRSVRNGEPQLLMKYSIPLAHQKRWKGVYSKVVYHYKEVEPFMDLKTVNGVVKEELKKLQMKEGKLRDWLSSGFHDHVYGEEYQKANKTMPLYRVIAIKDCPEDIKADLLKQPDIEQVQMENMPQEVQEKFKPF